MIAHYVLVPGNVTVSEQFLSYCDVPCPMFFVLKLSFPTVIKRHLVGRIRA